MAASERWRGHPPLPADLEALLPDLVDRLRRGGARLVYLFGSSARGADRGPGPGAPNDVDLAVWGIEDLRLLRADLEELLGTDRLDVIRLETADPDFRYRVLSSGRLLYASDSSVENEVELRILREYQDLAPVRRRQAELVRKRHRVGDS